ncbi:MAG TPA: RidA family protein [Homoserinimonas sp.]|nr:RidA family protein [Homoserinimonas sp.]
MSITIANAGIRGIDAVAVKVTGPSGLYFLSGINPNPVYHGQPLTDAEAALPAGIRDQAELMLTNLSQVLDGAKLGWSSVVKIILYLTDIREAGTVRAAIVERFGAEWAPAFTTVQVDNLVARGARVQLDVIAAGAAT